MKIKKLIALLTALVIFCSCVFVAHTAVSAETPIPTVHPTNVNYVENVSSFGNDLWGVNTDTYLTLDKANKKLSWSYFNGPFLAQGISLNTKYATLLSLDTNVSNPEGRIDIIFRAKGVTDYYVLLVCKSSVFLYRYVYGAGDILIDESDVSYKRHSSGNAHIDILSEENSVSVWIDGVNYFENYELELEEYPIAMGFNAANVQLGTDVITVSNYKLSYVENEDLFAPIPVFPEGNEDLIKNVTDLQFQFGAFGSYNNTEKKVTLTGASTGGSGLMNNLNFDVKRAYVVSGTIDVPKSGTSTRVLVAGASAGDNISVYFFDETIAVYGLGGYIESVVYASTSFTRTFTEKDGKKVPDKIDFTILMENDAISVWVNGKNVIDQADCLMIYDKANIGFNISGLEGTSQSITISNLQVYYKDTDVDYMDKLLGDIPELKLSNYREMRTRIPELRQEVNKYVNKGGKLSDLKNYEKLIKAEADLKIFDNDFMVQDLIYVEDCITNIPSITTENYKYQLENSEEYTLAYATEIIEWLLDAYPELSTNDISNYNKYSKALKIANNNGVSPNLFDSCTGVSSVSGGITTYDPEYNRAVVKGTSFYKFDNVSIDPQKVYVYEMDVFQTKTKGHTRIAFKGTGANDYLYVGFVGDTATIYDPLDGIERHVLGTGKFERPTDRAYHVKIITGPGYATVICDGKVVVSAMVDDRYTGQFFAVYSYDNASATFENINLYYYDGEKVDYSGKSLEENLLYGATNIHGIEAGLGFYGTLDTETDTVNILSNGMGGIIDGVVIDYTKPIVFTANVKTDSLLGSVNLMIAGKDSLTGVTVGIGSNQVDLTEYESGLPITVVHKVYFPRKANQSYKTEILYEEGKVSLFINGVCYYRDVNCDRSFLGDTIGFFNKEITGTSSIANLNINYATEEQIQRFNALKIIMPEHRDPNIVEEEDSAYEDDYIVETEEVTENNQTEEEETQDSDEYDDDSDDYSDEEEYENSEENVDEDQNDSNKKKRLKKITTRIEQIDVRYYAILFSIIGGAVLLIGGGVLTFFLIRKKKKNKI